MKPEFDVPSWALGMFNGALLFWYLTRPATRVWLLRSTVLFFVGMALLVLYKKLYFG